MTHTVTVADTKVSFPCGSDETVLDAAERAGYTIPYSCRKGVCASCEGQLVTGSARVRGQGKKTGPTAHVRFCQAKPESDLMIAPGYLRRADIPDRKSLTAEVYRIENVAPDVTVLKLRFPIGRRAPFNAGQYLRVRLPDGDSRNYSMANAPKDNDGAELHIRVIAGGMFSDSVLTSLKPGDTVDIEVPFGTFSFDTTKSDPAVFLASGTGFAPISAMLKDQIDKNTERRVHLYWGARKASDLYAIDILRQWESHHDWLQVTPVLSESDSDWIGRTGLVHHSVMEDYSDMRALEVYACGAPVMVNAAKKDFVSQCKLEPAAFFADAFVESGSNARFSGPET